MGGLKHQVTVLLLGLIIWLIPAGVPTALHPTDSLPNISTGETTYMPGSEQSSFLSLHFRLEAAQQNPNSPSTEASENTSANLEDLSSDYTLAMFILSAIILTATVLFILEPIRLDLIAICIPVVLILFGPQLHMDIGEALSGFSNPATLTVLAMFVLSEGVRRSGAIQYLGDRLSEYMGTSSPRQISVLGGVAGTISGVIPNTPVVAIFIPLVSDFARKMKTSPSKLLIPLSYAAMLGGMLTLLGTSTNLLASAESARLIDHPFGIFEFTKLGLVVFATGMIYLVFVSHYLIPERIEPDRDLTREYEMRGYLTEVVIESDSRLIGRTVGESLQEMDLDMEVVQMVRAGKQFMEPLSEKTLRAGDHLIIRTDQETLMDIRQQGGLHLLPEIQVTERQLEEPVRGQKLVEVVIPNGSLMEGETMETTHFPERYASSILAVRRGEELTHQSLEEFQFSAGDVLLILATEQTVDRLQDNRNFIITQEFEKSDYRTGKMPFAVGIVAAVILLAAFHILDIVMASLGGMVAMVATGCLKPGEIYEAINWEVIFLLAGLIPLGIAMEQSGLAEYLTYHIIRVGSDLPVIVMLGVFYLFTAGLTNLISNNASIVLMIPVAVKAALTMGAEPFPFVLAVTFASSTAFLTPMGYQTNLMVYGSGGYKFRDFIIAGLPLQLLLVIVTPLGIAMFWNV